MPAIFGASGELNDETLWALNQFAHLRLEDESHTLEAGPTANVIFGLDRLSAESELSFGRESEIGRVDAWLTPQLSGVFSAVSTSDIVFHPTPRSALASFNAALDECQDDRAFVLIGGWDFWRETPIGPGGVTVEDVLDPPLATAT